MLEQRIEPTLMSFDSKFGLMNIRQATTADAPLVLDFLRDFRAEGLQTVLQHASLPTAQDEETFIQRLDGAARAMFVALDDERVVGCLNARVYRHPQFRHTCEFGVGVLKSHRGAGVGSALIGGLLQWSRQRGLRRIELTVVASNTAAIGLYRRLGFREECRKVGAIRRGARYEDVIHMAMRVEGAVAE
jgi:RimJ/RimL family protein N-acetyltransferase